MPAVSQAQRAYLNAKFGHAWVKAHGFDNKGKLPAHKKGRAVKKESESRMDVAKSTSQSRNNSDAGTPGYSEARQGEIEGGSHGHHSKAAHDHMTKAMHHMHKAMAHHAAAGKAHRKRGKAKAHHKLRGHAKPRGHEAPRGIGGY